MPLVLGTLVAAFQPARVATAQGTALSDCRALLLRFVDSSCGPQNPCPQPDLVAADDACRQAVEDQPTSGEARLLRAYTRLARLGEEDDPGADFRANLQGILDRFGFSTTGAAHQYGLTADGRSLVDFTAAPPLSTDLAAYGRADGSISKHDPFGSIPLEAGAYILAVAWRFTPVEDVIAGSSPYVFGYTVTGNEIDGYRRALSDHGDYRIQVTGDVDVSLFEGTLEREDDGLSVDRLALAVLSDGEVVFDVLSWEQDPAGQYKGAPVDVNADGEIAFLRPHLFVFRDDGQLDAADLVVRIEGSGELPIDLPDDAPTGGDLQHGLVTAWLPAIEASLADLAAIPGQAIEVSLTPNSAPLIELHEQVAGAPAPRLEVDHGDVKFFEAVLELARATILLASALDLELDLDSLTPTTVAVRIQQQIIDAHAPLLTFVPGAAAPLAAANEANRAAIDAYLAASRFVRNETDDQADDLFVLPPRGR
ncbi:MAG: hypothetical protein QNK03_21945, partial [Myxococcota bacterium]|nr:hypothetical protein [Myxococcota bacterium]